jgi:acetolactate synthase-1/2/3 large subunit
MPSVSVAGSIARFLRAQGVKHVFSVSGESVLGVYDACLEEGLSIIHTRQENAALHMADGWARVTGQPGVALVTLGAGAANTLAGLACAAQDAIPLVLIAGRLPAESWGTGAFGDFDAASALRPVAKATHTVLSASGAQRELAQAFREARAGRPGPVFVEIPVDVLGASVPANASGSNQSVQRLDRPAGEQAEVRRVADALRTARRPLLLAGSGVWWSDAAQALRVLIEVAHLPAFLDRLAVGLLPGNHPMNFGSYGVPVSPIFRQAAESCDVVLLVGGRFDFELEFGRPFASSRPRIIQVDIEPTEIGRGLSPDFGILGDARAVLEQIVELLRQDSGTATRRDWIDQLREIRAAHRKEQAAIPSSSSGAIHPLRLCHELNGVLGNGSCVSLGGGDIYSWGRATLCPSWPGRLLRPHKSWALGTEIPFALAAKLARPDWKVVALCGDGSFGYSAMEMDTAARYGAAIVCVIANDSGWSMIRWPQRYLYGPDRVYGTNLEPRRYERVVEALGGYGECVTEVDEIRPALERAFASGKPACLNVMTESVPSPDTVWSYTEYAGRSVRA